MIKTDDLKLKALFRVIDNETPPEYPIHYPPPAAWSGLKSDSKILKGWVDLKNKDNDFVLYIHFPFCENICGFCGFFALKLLSKKDIDAYLKLLDREAAFYASSFKNKKFSWFCVGGGTPSLMSPAQIKIFFQILKKHFNFSEKVRIAFESHPDDLDFDKLKLLKSEGVDWLSIGVQSFDDELLKKNQRTQDNGRISQVVSWARKTGIKNIQVDLIAGLPFQSEKSFLKDIERVKKLSPERIYLFPFQSKARGRLKTQEHPWLWNAYRQAMNNLSASGYEISCGRWVYKKTGGDWPYSYDQGERISKNFYSVLGIGPSAISYARGKARYRNFSAYEEYRKNIGKKSLPIEKVFYLSMKDEMRNFLILNLLQRGVIEKSEFDAVFNRDMAKVFASGISNLKRLGIVSFSKGKYYLNDRENGFFYLRKEFYTTKLLKKIKQKYSKAIKKEYSNLKKENSAKKSLIKKNEFAYAGFGAETFECLITNKCKAHCGFCRVRELNIESSEAILKKMYIERKQNHKKNIVFSGGESSTLDNLQGFIKFAKELKYERISLFSNGIDLSSELLSKFMKSGLNGLELSIHSHSAVIHNEIMGIKGALKKALKTLEEALNLGLYVRINSIILKSNYCDIFKTFNMLKDNFQVKNFRYIFVNSANIDKKNLIKWLPDWRKAVLELKAVYDCKIGGLDIKTINLPPCLALFVKKHPEDDLNVGFNSNEPGIFKRAGFIKPAKCIDCALQLNCPGVDEGYIAAFGDAAIKPLSHSR